MTTRDVGKSDYLMPAYKCTEHDFKFQYSIGLTITDDPLTGEKVASFEWSKSDKKLFSADWEKFGKGEDHNPWEGISIIK